MAYQRETLPCCDQPDWEWSGGSDPISIQNGH